MNVTMGTCKCGHKEYRHRTVIEASQYKGTPAVVKCGVKGCKCNSYQEQRNG